MCVKVSIDHSSVLFVLLVEVSSDQFCCAMITLQMLRTRKLGVLGKLPRKAVLCIVSTRNKGNVH